MTDLSNYSLLVICFVIIVIFGYKYVDLNEKLYKQIAVNENLKTTLNVNLKKYNKLKIEYSHLKDLIKNKHIKSDDKLSTELNGAKGEIKKLNNQLRVFKMSILNDSKKKEQTETDYLNITTKYTEAVELLAKYNVRYKMLIGKINNLKEFSSKSNLDYERVIIRFEDQSKYISNIIDIYTPFISNYESLLRKLMTVKDPELNSFFRKLILEFRQKRMED